MANPFASGNVVRDRFSTDLNAFGVQSLPTNQNPFVKQTSPRPPERPTGPPPTAVATTGEARNSTPIGFPIPRPA